MERGYTNLGQLNHLSLRNPETTRQRIREFATPNTHIMVLSKQGEVLKTYTMDSLLPDAFGPEQLPGR
ncbi:hypothetical protein P8S55_06845 [Halomonas sp. M1]|nr:hypothetical protein P8S55_06845 [Halomonas sp. M1]